VCLCVGVILFSEIMKHFTYVWYLPPKFSVKCYLIRFCAVCLFTCKTPKSDLTSFAQNGPPYDRDVHTWPYATIIRKNGPPYDRDVHTWPYATIIRNSWNIYYVQLTILDKLLGVRRFLALLSRDWIRWRTRERSKKAITS